jgi:hypothetical protein
MNQLPAVAQPRYELNQIRDMAGAIAQSGLFGIKTKAQAYALLLIADAEGLHPATVAQDYDVIQGRPARKTHSVLARFQQAGGSVEWQELTEQRAAAKFTHPRGGSVVIEWTIEMAKRARLTGKDNWTMYPRAMLRARCIGEGVRAVYPAALGGSLLVEEAQDLEAGADGVFEPAATAQPEGFKVTRKAKAATPTAAAAAPAAAPADDVTDVEPKATAPSQAPAPAPAAPAGGDLIGAGEVAYLKNKSKAIGADLDALLAELGGLVLDKLTKADFQVVKGRLMGHE